MPSLRGPLARSRNFWTKPFGTKRKYSPFHPNPKLGLEDQLSGFDLAISCHVAHTTAERKATEKLRFTAARVYWFSTVAAKVSIGLQVKPVEVGVKRNEETPVVMAYVFTWTVIAFIAFVKTQIHPNP